MALKRNVGRGGIAALGILALVACTDPELPRNAPRSSAVSSVRPPMALPDFRVCYVTHLGDWNPAVDERSFWFWQIPHSVRLTSERVIEPIVYDEKLQRKRGMWELREDHLFVSWSDGFTSVSAKLRPSKEGLTGTAETFEDGNPAFRRHAPLTLEPTACTR